MIVGCMIECIVDMFEMIEIYVYYKSVVICWVLEIFVDILFVW